MDGNFSILTRECKTKKLVVNNFLFKLCFVINVLNYKAFSAQACVISPNFSQLGLRPRRLSIKRYHARFPALMVKYF